MRAHSLKSFRLSCRKEMCRLRRAALVQVYGRIARFSTRARPHAPAPILLAANRFPPSTRLPRGLTFAASADSKGKLLVAGLRLLQMLAGDLLHIVAFGSAGTTSRTACGF